MREQRNDGNDGRPVASPTSSNSSSSAGSSSSIISGGSGNGGTGGDLTPNGGAVQFLPIRSRVGKRYQATVPELLDADARAKKKQMHFVHVPRSRFIPERARSLGDELEQYLALARTLRDGVTLETEEQVHAIALQYLHRFDYNATDAACSLYARHSIEVPTTASANTSTSTSAEDVATWLTTFYELLRAPVVRTEHVARMQTLLDRAQTHRAIAPLTEAAVLSRLVTRIRTWEAHSAALADRRAARSELVAHVHVADDMALVSTARDALEHRVRAFGVAFAALKDALDRGGRRNQPKATLDELEQLYAAVTRTDVTYPEEQQYAATLQDARALAETIATMLQADKVSLSAMRDVLAKLELVPVSFAREVVAFQQKMATAQTWLAKARKCIPKRRGTRRSGGTSIANSADSKKLDLDAIRALVDDAPCDDSAEVFEMQDLLECADEWAEKVKAAIEGGAEIALDDLKELYDEGNDMPVDMDEQTFLAAEIAAREWCVRATAMLAARKPLRALEALADDAKAIRARLHAKKQARWKPQVERDIHAAIDTARRWIHDVRDVVGSAAFDKLLASSAGTASVLPTASTLPASSDVVVAKKKPLASVDKLLDKATRLVVNVSAYVDALRALQTSGYALRDDVRALLVAIGCVEAATTLSDSDATRTASEQCDASGSVDGSSAVESTTATAMEVEKVAAAAAVDASAEQSTPTDAAAVALDATDGASTTVAMVDASTPVDYRDVAVASAMLERVHALPFHLDDGDVLERVLVADREWATRVRDALPPRQSRKKRQTKHAVTRADLEALQREAAALHFRFPDELRVLAKELEDLAAWQRKARAVIETPIADHIAALVPKLRDHDLAVYAKLQAAKAKRAAAHDDVDALPPRNDEVAAVASEVTAVDRTSESLEAVKHEGDVEMADVSSSAVADTVAVLVAAVADSAVSSSDAVAGTTDATSAVGALVPIDADAILSRVRLESGCMQRQPTSDRNDGDASVADTSDVTVAGSSSSAISDASTAADSTSKSKKKKSKSSSSAAGDGSSAVSLLEPILAMAEKSLEAIAELETRSDRTSELETIEELVDDVDSSSSAFTDDAVKVLEAWHDAIVQVIDEGELLSAVAPELQVLMHVVELLTWLQSARSLFYDEMLPLRALVGTGHDLAVALQQLQGSSTIDSSTALLSPETFATLELMLWPLPHLEAQHAVVESWRTRVQRCITAKRVRVETLATLLREGDALLMEPDAFEVIDTEVKRAKTWLAKLKKRVKAFMTKHVARLSMSVARAFVDDGDAVAIALPVFDYLKDNVDVASDWETRVLASGLETGHARIANLVALATEYDTAGLIIDLDSHRAVLASATERYCICRQPFDGLMIGCDECDDWFHDNCIGMSKEKAERVEQYTCPSCTVLAALADAVAQANAVLPTLWDDAAYVASFDKHHGVFARKLKREEKAVEKSEMQRFSISSQMNHLRVAIEALERRKSLGAVAASDASSGVSGGSAGGSGGPADAIASGQQQQQQPSPSSSHAVATETPSSAVRAGAATATEGACEPPIAASTATSPPPAIAATSLPTPSILLPLAPAAGKQSTGSSLTAATTPNGVSSGSVPMTPTTPTAAATLVAAANSNDVEAQLTTMRNEHAELMLQINDAHETLRLSKERLQIARDGLRDLGIAHNARSAGLASAKAWVLRAVAALNTPSLLTRTKLSPDTFVPDAFATLLAELEVVVAPTPAPTPVSMSESKSELKSESTSTPTSAPIAFNWVAHIDTIFPEVRVYARLLRLVGWSLVVVSLLQERPSRAALASALAYAVAHSLWDPKTVASLRGVLGRIDAWIAKVHKSVAKTGLSKSQRLPRLKLFLNEYSKLPLTCAPLADALEVYINAADNVSPSADKATPAAIDAAEAAVISAFTSAAATVSMSAATTSNALSSGGAAGAGAAMTAASAIAKMPRKRKPYVRRERPAGSAKKSKKSASGRVDDSESSAATESASTALSNAIGAASAATANS